MTIMRASTVATTDGQFIKEKINTALRQCEKGRHDAAISVFDELINNIPEETELEILFGSLCFQLGERSRAINYLSRALLREPDNVFALKLLGTVFLEDRQLGKAVAALKKSIELQPDGPNAYESYANLGATYLKLNRYGKAVDMLEQAFAMKPSNAGTNASLASGYRLLNRYDDAFKYAQKAVKLDPKEASYWHLMGLIHSETGNPEEAIKCFEKAININKAFGAAYNHLAKARKFSAADSKIIARFENALKASMPPDQRAVIHFGLGKIYDDCKEWDKAFLNFRQGNLLAGKSMEQKPPRKHFKQAKRVFTQPFLNLGELRGSQSNKPVFVVGMPRSGTTLIEQIIASHSLGAGAGDG